MQIRHILPAGLIALTAGLISATPLTPGEALQRIASSSPAKARAHVAPQTLSLSRTLSMSATDPTPAIYIFTAPDGAFVITGADTSAPAIIGYGPAIDPEAIPSNMQGWLEACASQVAWLTAHPAPERSQTTDHDPVAPLLTTTWNQDAPYNDLAPTDKGGRAVTGCVATAMAQIINYHRWPATHGFGSHSYKWEEATLSFDYAATTFDWPNMLDTYDSSSPAEARSAVATLMYACGVAVDMQYSSSASGAYSLAIAPALVRYFGFDHGAAYLLRDYFTAEQWDEKIYAEIAAGRPVCYAGVSNLGGHQFVADGYQADGYYHINWGWGGLADGYFLLSALDPYQQGIGGSGDSSAFNFNQDAVTGIQPPVEGSTRFYPIYVSGPLVWNEKEEYLMVAGVEGGIYNYSSDSYDISAGLRLEADDNTIYYALGEEPLVFHSYFWGYSGLEPVYPDDLPAGTYTASPGGFATGSDTWIPFIIPAQYSQTITVRKGLSGRFTYDGSDPDEGYTLITGPAADATTSTVDVYNLQGQRLRHNVAASAATRGLPAGVYIVGGRKIIVN